MQTKNITTKLPRHTHCCSRIKHQTRRDVRCRRLRASCGCCADVTSVLRHYFVATVSHVQLQVDRVSSNADRAFLHHVSCRPLLPKPSSTSFYSVVSFPCFALYFQFFTFVLNVFCYVFVCVMLQISIYSADIN